MDGSFLGTRGQPLLSTPSSCWAWSPPSPLAKSPWVEAGPARARHQQQEETPAAAGTARHQSRNRGPLRSPSLRSPSYLGCAQRIDHPELGLRPRSPRPDGCEPVEWMLMTTGACRERGRHSHRRRSLPRPLAHRGILQSAQDRLCLRKAPVRFKHALLNISGHPRCPSPGCSSRSARHPRRAQVASRHVFSALAGSLVPRAALRRRVGRDVLPPKPSEPDITYGIARLWLHQQLPPTWLARLGLGLPRPAHHRGRLGTGAR